MGNSVAQNIGLEEKRSGIDRRSGKDRRRYYDEKRKMHRSKLKTGVFVLFKKPRLLRLLQPMKLNFAEILDLSLSGLQAQYSAPAILKYEYPILSITSNDGAIKIDGLPFKVIADKLITKLPNNRQLRRCRLKFEDISDRHKTKLNQILQKFSE